MMPIAHSSLCTTVLNPPNLAGFGAAANSNAKYACEDSGRSDKRITIRVTRCALGVAIAVVDNGVGIPSENVTRIFSHGFTTRPSGHGFGLHSAALAAQELKGSLRVASDGPGCGATFWLELPITPAKDSL